MKAVATLAFCIVTAVGGCFAAASVASLVMAKSEAPHLMVTSAPDLWTETPVRVDPSKQAYERLPPLLSTYAANVSKIGQEPRPLVTSAAPKQDRLAGSRDHADWCAAKYRSFDPETNSYRSFSGDIRTCVSPFDGSSQAAAMPQDQGQTTEAVPPSVASWCANRYQSYRADDNTYQPYDGPRRTCEGPRVSDQIVSSL
ncbi:MAG: BA14K family protein [Rhizobiaceae bacterium]|nr:BA14K family protein [Rhizobiaceae bacterium]